VVVQILAIFTQNSQHLFAFVFLDLAGPELIKFGIESKRFCEETSTEGFIDAISLALDDMRDICEQGPDSAQVTARL
jgi:hypothetical protein